MSGTDLDPCLVQATLVRLRILMIMNSEDRDDNNADLERRRRRAVSSFAPVQFHSSPCRVSIKLY